VRKRVKHREIGLIRGVASLEGDNLVIFYFLVAFKIGLIRGVASLKGDNLVIFYCLIAFEIGLIKGVASLEGGQFSNILLPRCI
jgi:hypothetical protein